jgi:exopolysaccharide biosynthesis polyprenyl glycosylphosphotransferase
MQQNKKIHFEISERKILLRLFDVGFVIVFLFCASLLFDFGYLRALFSSPLYAITFSIYITLIGTVFEMYDLQNSSSQFQITKSIILTASISVLLYLLTPFFAPILPKNRLQILAFYILVLAALFIWRFLYLNFLASGRFQKNVILICDCDQLSELVDGLQNIDPHYKIIGFVNSDGQQCEIKNKPSIFNIDVDHLEEYVGNNSISEIVIASQKTDGITNNLYNQLIHLHEKGNIIKEYTQVYETITQRIPVQYVSRDFYKFFPFNRNNQNHLYLILVRFFEVVTSIIGIAIGICMLPLILVGNLLGNRGKLFYKQKRVGKNGRVFKIYKLRSMIKNAEKNGAVFSQKNDSRVTAFGKFLRKTRIDEFPQFLNILKGEMGVIGPRPERPVFVKEISEIMPFYETRHVIKPGLTGWAQVNFSYGATIDDSLIKLQYDLYYIKHRSVFLDVNIIIKTFSAVLYYRGQ